MREGYLIVETRADRAGLIRLRAAERFADRTASECLDSSDLAVHFAARFTDLDTARMHAHNHLRRHTVDAEAGLYRTDPATATAAVDAIDLKHQVAYLAPVLNEDPRRILLTQKYRARQRQINRIFTGVGIAAVILLFVLSVLVGR